MKKQGAVRHKLKQVKHRLLKKAIRNGMSKKPCNCSHSGQVKGNANDPLFYVCLLDSSKPKEWDGVICDPSVPNNCPFFKPHKTEQEIKEEFETEFDSLIKEGDMGKIATKYSDVAALLWVLADSTDETEDDDDD
tara:strand:- start:799 stop:1203 length:405 start_codon:yes stop_codon:yes gene_type:complete